MLEGSLEPSIGEINVIVEYFIFLRRIIEYNAKECIVGLKTLELFIEKYSQVEIKEDNNRLINTLVYIVRSIVLKWIVEYIKNGSNEIIH